MSSRFIRKSNTRKPDKVIHIYTEGKKTETNYFNAIKDELLLTQVDIKICGCGDHTLPLVKWVIERKDEILETDEDSEWWVVFDKDDFDNFEEAINLAKSKDINVAYSNECFELWFLLHFEYLQTSIGRKKYFKKLSTILGKDYEKNNSDMYNFIKGKESIAINNAKRLDKMHDDEKTFSLEKRDPSTSVYKLVENLRKLKTDVSI